MPNRILKDSICTSANIDALSRDAEVFFYRLLVQCDDFGRMDARPAILRAKCYPLQIERVANADISEWLGNLMQAGLIVVYTVNNQPYLQVCTWDRHQQIRAKRSKYPEMIASDINCNQVQANVPVIQSNTNQSENNTGRGDSGWLVVKSAYESNIGAFTSMSSEMVHAAYEEFGEVLVVDAISVAVKANIRKWSYVDGILAKWRAEGRKAPSTNGKPRAKQKAITTDPFTGEKTEVYI